LSGPRLKILHLLVSLPVGGAEDVVATVVQGLDPERFSVTAACIGSLGPVGEELAAEGHQVISLGLDLNRTSFWRVVAAVRRLLMDTRPHILHTHLYHPNLYGRLAALGLGLRGVVAEVHNVYTRRKFHRRLWNWLLARASDYVLVVSPQVWDDVRRYDWISPSRLRLLPNGVNLAALETPWSREEAKSRLGVQGFCIGAVGRLEEQKGQTFLLAALPELRQEIPDLTVLLAGEGRQEEALRRQVAALGLEDVVHLLGTRRDMALIYRALDLFILPSLWEGLPLALLQAMGAALPVVATRVGGVPEVIQDGVNGLLVSTGDSSALAAAILEAYRQAGLRQRLGAAAQLTVQESYSQETMLRRLESLYLELGEKGRRS